MFRSFVISAIRNLVRNRQQSLIQILSLSLGLTVFSLVALYLYDEITVDRTNPDFDKIFRVQLPDALGTTDVVTTLMAPELEGNIPEIKHISRLYYMQVMSVSIINEQGEKEKGFKVESAHVDPGFLQIFPQEFIIGSKETALEEPHSIVLTRSFSEKLFGHRNPMGEIVRYGGSDVRITGIIEDPKNTHLKYEILLSIDELLLSRIKRGKKNDVQTLRSFKAPTYISIQDHVSPREVKNKIDNVWDKYLTSTFGPGDSRVNSELVPLSDVRSTEIKPWHNYMRTTNLKILKNFFSLGLAMLILGIINYVNLTTARASQRNREVTMKKIVGSSRSRLIVYFLTESVITTFFSFLIALTCMQLLFPQFNNFLQADINLYFLFHPIAWILILALIVAIGIISGLYPALSMTSNKPVIVAVRETTWTGKAILTRRILMLVQFSTAVCLMIIIFVMSLQIWYMKNEDLGFPDDQIVWTKVGDYMPLERVLLMSRLENLPGIERVCLSASVPGFGFQETTDLLDDPNSAWHGMDIEVTGVTPAFFDLYDMEFVSGEGSLDRFINRRFVYDTLPGDGFWYFYINETAAKVLKDTDPAGFKEEDRIILGVVKDFHYQSLQFPVKPLFIQLSRPGTDWLMSLRIKSQNIQKTLRAAEYEFKKIKFETVDDIPGDDVDNTYRFMFIDDSFNEQYLQVQRVQKASLFIAILAIIIACLGLYGLSTFMTQRRTKEIGIRKSLGATDLQLFMILSWDLIRWVFLSVLVGIPAGWLLATQWQKQFAFRNETGVWVMFVAAILAFSISFFTSGYQAYKTARTNPVDSLRYE